MRPYGSPEQLERRRRQAIQLLRSGAHLSAVALKLGCSKSSVSRWNDVYRKRGIRGLRPKPIPGRPSRLSPGQKERLARTLLKGALAHGYRTDLWTLQRIAEVIGKRFRVQYHPNHVWRLMQGLGWSSQKPERRALQRNEEEIVRWKRYRWPNIKKRQTVGSAPGLPRREWVPPHPES